MVRNIVAVFIDKYIRGCALILIKYSRRDRNRKVRYISRQFKSLWGRRIILAVPSNAQEKYLLIFPLDVFEEFLYDDFIFIEKIRVGRTRGRIKIPELIEMFVGLGEFIDVVPCGDYLEIWPQDSYDDGEEWHILEGYEGFEDEF